jgi:chromosome segregation ATPase
MDVTPPLVLFTVIVVAISVWVGHMLGRSGEEKRKIEALKSADEAAKSALEDLRRESQEKLDVLAKAGANDLENQKQAHARQLDQVNQAHQTLVESLKSTHLSEIERINTEHSGQLDRLNSSNNATINELEQRRHNEITALKSETAEAVATLKREHQQALDTLRQERERAVGDAVAERDRRIQEIEQRNQQDVSRLQSHVDTMEAERERNRAQIAELEQTLTELRDEVKEARLNNMFSVSKSGDKLIRVVRSVQELATELDETSRTVTGGEYSFFDQIKDQRDRDAVLRLAGDDNQVVGAHAPGVDVAEAEEVETARAEPAEKGPAA